MPLEVLIVPDKFKGTLTAQAAAEAIARGWQRSRPTDRLTLLPMSDGGDGFGEIISQLFDAKPQVVATVDAARRPIEAQWWWSAKTKTAIIESAKVIGLALLPPKKYHPFELDTFGLGALCQTAAEQGARRCVVGIGGSATNDGGFGLARSLGWQFINEREETPLARWTELWTLRQASPPRQPLRFPGFLVAVDVQNPLLGAEGASRIYGPQKGLTEQEVPLAERCLARLAEVMRTELKQDFASEPGAGAAGGLGFGLRCFLGATLQPGFALFAEHAKLLERLRSAQLVITGEGAIDKSSFMGKGVGEVVSLCRSLNVPCIGLAGTFDAEAAKNHFARRHGLTPELTTEAQARTRAGFWLEQLAAQVAGDWA